MTWYQTLWVVISWAPRQAVGWLGNVRDLFAGLRLSSLVPPAVWSSLRWLAVQFPRVVGLGTPEQQIVASVVLIGASIATSLFTGGVTLFFVAVFAITFLVGAARLWPAVDSLWPLGGGA